MGGIGGGGLIVPLTMALFGFSTKDAIAISGFTIFTGAVARFFYNLGDRHPEKNGPIIEYSLVIVMMPMVLVGSFCGVIINIILPDFVLSIILTILLIGLAIQSLRKGVQLYKKETVNKLKKQEDQKIEKLVS